MISKIKIEEFRKRLNNNVQFGNPKMKGTPFQIPFLLRDSNKIFFGKYNKTKFELTKNSALFPTPFIITGDIKSKNNRQTELNYDVKPIGFGYYWLKYFPSIGVVIFNVILYIDSAPLKIFVLVNTILFGFVIFINFYMRWKKNKLLADFKKVFEVETQN